MRNTETIRLLLSHSDDSEAQRLASMLNNSGVQNRAVQVDSVDVLAKHLSDSEWDIMIVHNEQSPIGIREAVSQIRKHDLFLPIIALSEDEHHTAVITAMKAGACDLVLLDHDQHLLQVLKRELSNLAMYRDAKLATKRTIDLERRNHNLLDSSRDCVGFVEDGILLYANEAFANLLGHADADDIECMPIFDMLNESDHSVFKEACKKYIATNHQGAMPLTLQFNGESSVISAPFELSVGRFDDQEAFQLYLRNKDINSDSTNANIDAASGLFTRRALFDLAQAKLDDDQCGSWCQLQLENFSQISSSAGVEGIDSLVNELSLMVKTEMGTLDIGRLSDNNIAVFFNETDTKVTENLISTLVDKIEDHIFTFDDRTFYWQIRASIVPITKGIDAVPVLVDRASELIQQASKIDKVKLYEPDINDDSTSDEQIAATVAKALEDDRFLLHFQPIVGLQDTSNPIYEVLLRMLDDDKKPIAAHEFIEATEKSGASALLDRWVVRESLKALSSKLQQGEHTKLIINISAGLLQDSEFFDWLSSAYKAAKAPGELITFQIRESVASEYLNQSIEFCKRVNEIGSQVCISHFGCTMNHDKMLEQLPVTLVKLDQSYTRDLQAGNKDGMSNLVKSLNQKSIISIIPFVESATTLASLWQLGVHFIQGHYLQAPTDTMNYDFDSE